MKKRIVLVILGLLVASPALSYDAALAERFAQFYEPFAGKACAKSLQMMKPEVFVAAMQSEHKPLVLDVRTEKETALIGITAADSLAMPMARVFTKETLDRLPTDRKIVVLCKAGHRATAVAMGLRQIGFEQVFVLKGGLVKLTQYLDPKTAHMPPPPQK